MDWLLTIILCVLMVELVLRLPFVDFLKSLSLYVNNVALILKVKASDHWKEKAMGAYAQRTFVVSAKIAGLLAAVLGAVMLVVLALSQLSPGFQAFILSWIGLGIGVVVASLYLVARRAVIRD